MEIDDIDQGEQRRVIDEFFHAGPSPGKVSGTVSRKGERLCAKRVPTPFAADLPDCVELDGRLADIVSRDAPAEVDDAGESDRPGATLPFSPGDGGGEVGPALDNERPQTIALVLAHLSPHRAGPYWSGCRSRCKSK